MVDTTILHANVNVWPVVVAGVAAWLVGSVWYMAFSKPWMALAYPDKKRQDVSTSRFGYFAALVYFLISALALAMFISYYCAQNVGDGMVVAALALVGFTASAFALNYLFGGRPLKLYLIDVGNYLVAYLVMGAILGGWQ
jgi:hypothetical protein